MKDAKGVTHRLTQTSVGMVKEFAVKDSTEGLERTARKAWGGDADKFEGTAAFTDLCTKEIEYSAMTGMLPPKQ